jgi:hypothetical protein
MRDVFAYRLRVLEAVTADAAMPLVACEDVRTPLGALRVVLGIGHLQILCRAGRAAPEGYTVSIGNTSAVYPVQYDVLKDFEAVSLPTNGPTCAAVSTWP